MAVRTAWRIASTIGWFSVLGKPQRGKSRKPEPTVHDDLCAIKDVHSSRIVGYLIDSPMKSRLTVQALDNAVRMRGYVAGHIVDSDRDSQFRSRKIRRTLTHH